MQLDWSELGLTQEEADDALSRAKMNLFFKNGAAFLGSIMGQTTFLWSTRKPTAWTNGDKVWINPYFFFKLPKASRTTLIAHELWHIARMHFARILGRDPKRWNIAGDHSINTDLKSEKYSFEGLEMGYCDMQYLGMSTEEIYDALPEDCGSDPDVIYVLADDIEPLDGEEGDSIPVTIEQIMGRIITAVQANDMSANPGKIPGEITLAINKFLSPKLNWRLLLRRYFTELSRSDYSYRRPNRRSPDDFILPSLMSDEGLVDMNKYQDISGSVSDQNILRFNSELAHIKRELNPENMNVITFDTELHDFYHFGEDDVFESIEVTGRGGTDLRCVREHIQKTKPTVAIIFTDLRCDPMEPVDVPVLWICVGNPEATVPFGTLIHIDDETDYVLKSQVPQVRGQQPMAGG